MQLTGYASLLFGSTQSVAKNARSVIFIYKALSFGRWDAPIEDDPSIERLQLRSDAAIAKQRGVSPNVVTAERRRAEPPPPPQPASRVAPEPRRTCQHGLGLDVRRATKPAFYLPLFAAPQTHRPSTSRPSPCGSRNGTGGRLRWSRSRGSEAALQPFRAGDFPSKPW